MFKKIYSISLLDITKRKIGKFDDIIMEIVQNEVKKKGPKEKIIRYL